MTKGEAERRKLCLELGMQRSQLTVRSIRSRSVIFFLRFQQVFVQRLYYVSHKVSVHLSPSVRGHLGFLGPITFSFSVAGHLADVFEGDWGLHYGFVWFWKVVRVLLHRGRLQHFLDPKHAVHLKSWFTWWDIWRRDMDSSLGLRGIPYFFFPEKSASFLIWEDCLIVLSYERSCKFRKPFARNGKWISKNRVRWQPSFLDPFVVNIGKTRTSHHPWSRIFVVTRGLKIFHHLWTQCPRRKHRKRWMAMWWVAFFFGGKRNLGVEN